MRGRGEGVTSRTIAVLCVAISLCAVVLVAWVALGLPSKASARKALFFESTPGAPPLTRDPLLVVASSSKDGVVSAKGVARDSAVHFGVVLVLSWNASDPTLLVARATVLRGIARQSYPDWTLFLAPRGFDGAAREALLSALSALGVASGRVALVGEGDLDAVGSLNAALSAAAGRDEVTHVAVAEEGLVWIPEYLLWAQSAFEQWPQLGFLYAQVESPEGRFSPQPDPAVALRLDNALPDPCEAGSALLSWSLASLNVRAREEIHCGRKHWAEDLLARVRMWGEARRLHFMLLPLGCGRRLESKDWNVVQQLIRDTEADLEPKSFSQELDLALNSERDEGGPWFAVCLLLRSEEGDADMRILQALALRGLSGQTYTRWTLMVLGVGLGKDSVDAFMIAAEGAGLDRNRIHFSEEPAPPPSAIDVPYNNLLMKAENRAEATHIAWLTRRDFWFPEHLEIHARSYRAFRTANYVYTQMASLAFWFFPQPKNRKIEHALGNLVPSPCATGVGVQSWRARELPLRFDAKTPLRSKR